MVPSTSTGLDRPPKHEEDAGFHQEEMRRRPRRRRKKPNQFRNELANAMETGGDSAPPEPAPKPPLVINPVNDVAVLTDVSEQAITMASGAEGFPVTTILPAIVITVGVITKSLDATAGAIKSRNIGRIEAEARIMYNTVRPLACLYSIRTGDADTAFGYNGQDASASVSFDRAQREYCERLRMESNRTSFVNVPVDERLRVATELTVLQGRMNDERDALADFKKGYFEYEPGIKESFDRAITAIDLTQAVMRYMAMCLVRPDYVVRNGGATRFSSPK